MSVQTTKQSDTASVRQFVDILYHSLVDAIMINPELETKASSHEGQSIPAGSSVSLPRMVLITMSIITMRSISRKLCVRLFTENLDRNFANLVAPPTNGYAKCLVRCKAHLIP